MGEKCYDVSDTHYPYLVDLLSCFKEDPECKATFGINIIPKSEYRGMDEDSQCATALWIIPLNTSNTSNLKSLDCGAKLTHRFMVCVAVKCPRNCRNNIDCGSDEEGVFLTGPMPEAAKLLHKVRCKIQECNKKKLCPVKDSCYSPFRLVEIPEPDAHNGFVHMCMIYETDFYY